ncbi:hypothetical protein QX776_05795 [Alteromonadaceae bacterium BrNp21-10]|nr:hypothetical protein [Alteromonadaceae bacterium BrNp21-10]
MSEDLIIELMNEYLNRTWSIMQFWASVSFGLIAVSHLAVKHLNVLMAIIISLLYSSFTLFVVSILSLNISVVNGFIQDLQNMLDAGTLVTQGALSVINNDTGVLQMVAIFTAFLGTFFGTLFFLWYSYAKNNKLAAIENDKKITAS